MQGPMCMLQIDIAVSIGGLFCGFCHLLAAS